MSVRLTPASLFSTEEEVSWGSQPFICLLGQECSHWLTDSTGQPQPCTPGST